MKNYFLLSLFCFAIFLTSVLFRHIKFTTVQVQGARNDTPARAGYVVGARRDGGVRTHGDGGVRTDGDFSSRR